MLDSKGNHNSSGDWNNQQSSQAPQHVNAANDTPAANFNEELDDDIPF